MRRRIKDKLKSQKGTSIFFGLLLFLAAAILSAVMVNGAVTTIKRVKSDRQAEQNYLICSSSAKLLQDAITDTKVVKTVTVTVTQQGKRGETKSETTTAWSVEGADSAETASPFGTILQSYVKEYVEYREKGLQASFPEKKLDISLPSGLTEQLKEATGASAVLTIDSGTEETSDAENLGCYITVKFSVGSGTDICRMVLSLNGSADSVSQTSGNTTRTTTTTTTTYTWTKNDIFYGEEKRTLKES